MTTKTKTDAMVSAEAAMMDAMFRAAIRQVSVAATTECDLISMTGWTKNGGAA